jgi:hypothetical protein
MMLILQLLILIGVGLLAWRVVRLERALAAAQVTEVTRELADFRAKAEIVRDGRKLLRERLVARGLTNASRPGQ